MDYLKKVSVYFVAILIFIGTSIITNPIKNFLKKNEQIVTSQSLEASIDKGFLFGILGGFRSIISDFVWLKAYLDWENKNITGCISAIELATSIDPYMITFWTQGAAMIAFDTPYWIVQKIPQERQSEKLLEMFKRKQGKIAIGLLDKSLSMFPDNSELLRQKGQIAIAIGDFKLAEKCFEVLSKEDNPTVYARRIYASLLVKNGKMKKAVKVLEAVLKETEADSPIRKILQDQIIKTKDLIKKTET